MNKADALYELRLIKAAKVDAMKMEVYRRKPLLWLKERLGEDPETIMWSLHEGYADHKWDGDEDPLASAWNAIAESYIASVNRKPIDYKMFAVESATGTGKTYWLARLVFWFLDCFPNSLVITTAPTESQLKIGLWAELSMIYPKIKKLRPKAQKWQLRLAMESSATEGMSEEEKLAQLENSWHAKAHITGVSANEESSNKARGFHRKAMLIVLEECTGIPLPILTAFQNTSTGNTNYIVAVGNPDNEFDTLHQLATQPNCKSFRISAFDHPNIVLQDELYAGAVTQSSINDRTTTYGKKSPLWNAMVRGISPAQSTDALIKKVWIEACLRKEFDPEDNRKFCYNAVGVDVANSANGDKAALAFGEGNVCKLVEEFQCENATHLAYNLTMEDTELDIKGYKNYHTGKIKDFDIQSECIGVDAVGVGVATVNAFADMDMQVTPLQGGFWEEAVPMEDTYVGGKRVEKPMYRFGTLRAQMYWEAREDIRNTNIGIDLENQQMEQQLVRELCIPKFVVKGNHIEIEGKESIKKRMGGKSPNVADAFVYWNWVRKGYRVNLFGFAALGTGEDD